MNKPNSEKLEKILDELTKVLDELTKKEQEYKEESQTVAQEEPKYTKETEESILEHKPETEVSIPPVVTEENVPLQNQNVAENLASQHHISTDTGPASQTVAQDTIASEGEILVNTIFVYPSTASECKDMFFNTINSTFARVSKTKIKLVPFLCIEYNVVEKDLLLQVDTIIEKVKNITNNVLFFIQTEALSNEQSVEMFISKISPYINIVKTLSFSELKMKSIYLDIAIDLLLTFSHQK